MKILITGPQGSGKTTQAEILAKKLEVKLIEAGEILRKVAQKHDELGEEVKKDLENGDLVEDQVVAKLIQAQATAPDAEDGFVMDGYPRTLESLKLFDPGFDQVFYLEVPDEVVIKRMLQRGREDDNQSDIEERLKLYHLETEQVLDYYRKLDKLITVDGQSSIEEIAREINSKITG